MLLPTRYYANKVRTILVALVDAHNAKYHERMWPAVEEAADDVIDVQLTIGGRKPLRFGERMMCVHAARTDGLKAKLQEWIDEARSRGSREQQRRSDGALPPPQRRSEKRPALKLVP